MSFESDLERGHKIEDLILGLIRIKYPSAHRIEGKFSDFDIFVPEQDIRVEVKYDPRSNDTGNYFIEKTDGGKDSGISVTTSDWWVHVDREYVVWILTDTLKFLIWDLGVSETSFPIDGKVKTGYLIKRDALLYTPFSFREVRAKCKNIPF